MRKEINRNEFALVQNVDGTNERKTLIDRKKKMAKSKKRKEKH